MHCSSTGSQGTVVHCSSTGSQGTVVLLGLRVLYSAL